ncbi:alpha/beta fold hydrolase [Nocardia sp. ET3-3]|uniref:Alpha/beta fold hydrolase n=1 Tax=Nocardia terrae TaxID=2675851 RepID=A0A7K1V6A6_9NOCA|nr:alpha/beta fold hydrolase [Nocardia terrae]MVU81648.1 alpha/beta fold hydrolase [Nocardia terrae]
MIIRNRMRVAAAIMGATALALMAGTQTPDARADTQPTIQNLVSAINSGLTTAGKALADTGVSSAPHSTIPTGNGPEMTDAIAAFTFSLANENMAPAGANDWNCKPSAAHPEPVVLLHGSWMNAYDGFARFSPEIKKAGFCVYALNYGQEGLLQQGGLGALIPGVNGVAPMEDAAQEVATFIDKVLTSTGAKKVDIVGHSQGGPVADQYLKFDGGAGKVDQLITFGATHHGTTLDGIATLGRRITDMGFNTLGFSQLLVGQGLIEQVAGSSFYATLDAAGDTVSGVHYTSVATDHDEISTPYDATFLKAGSGATVDNVTLQDGCGIDLSDHLSMMYSPRAVSIALHALDPAGHPDLVCEFNPYVL